MSLYYILILVKSAVCGNLLEKSLEPFCTFIRFNTAASTAFKQGLRNPTKPNSQAAESKAACIPLTCWQPFHQYQTTLTPVTCHLMSPVVLRLLLMLDALTTTTPGIVYWTRKMSCASAAPRLLVACCYIWSNHSSGLKQSRIYMKFAQTMMH